MSVILIDDSRLFLKAIDVPLELSTSDIKDFVDNEVENSALWTPDKISAYIKKGNSLCIYIASLESVFDDINKDYLESAKLIIPASSLLCAFNLQGACFLKNDETICAVEFQDNSITKIAATSALDGNFDLAKANALALAGIKSEDISTYKFTSIKYKYGKIEATLSKIDSEDNIIKSFSITEKTKAFSTAELRTNEMLKEAKASFWRRIAKNLAIRSIPVFILLMTIFQISIIFDKFQLEKAIKQLEEIEPKAKKIEAQSAEIAKLASFKGKKIRPIETLALINSMRSDDIYFERIAQENVDNVSVSGSADSINSVKEFIDALNQSGSFDAKMESDTSRGKTRFTINIKCR